MRVFVGVQLLGALVFPTFAMDASQLEQLIDKTSAVATQVHAEKKQADQEAAKASDELKDAERGKHKYEMLMKQTQAKKDQAEVLFKRAEEVYQKAKEDEKIQQDNAKKTQAEQAETATDAASKDSLQVLRTQRDAGNAKMHSLFCIVVGLCVLLILVVAVVAWNGCASKAGFSLSIPFLSKPKPYEAGLWKRDDGEYVRIGDGEILHSDGKKEDIVNIDKEKVYTLTESVSRTWLGNEKQIITGRSARAETPKRLRWDDGRVWVKADDKKNVRGVFDGSVIGA